MHSPVRLLASRGLKFALVSGLTLLTTDTLLAQKAASGSSILNTHLMTDAEDKETAANGPVLSESFLKSITRNFAFTVYARAGFQFNGSDSPNNREATFAI